MSAFSAIQKDMRREITHKELPNGRSHKRLDVCHGEYRVVHVIAGDDYMVFGSTEPQVAAAVFDAFDGEDRGWHKNYLPRGLGGRSSSVRDSTTRVYAVGNSIVDCLHAFCDWMGQELVDNSYTEFADNKAEFQWGGSFQMFSESNQETTGMKIAGRKVPGGYVATWWK